MDILTEKGQQSLRSEEEMLAIIMGKYDLDIIGGYLKLAVSLKKNKKLHGEVFNFGPNYTKNYKVIFFSKIRVVSIIYIGCYSSLR